MSGFKGVLKEGWHPKGKEGGKESWRGDFKGINQVAGWMGKGKDPDTDRSEHVSAPLSSLKDPKSFGPPPKHIGVHGPGAVPNQRTPDRSGLGAPLSREQISQQNERRQEAEEAEEEEAQRPAPPPLPYRVNTTGLDTSNLPPPPKRVGSQAELGSASASPKPKPPSVPPRVPPRSNVSTPASHTPSPPPPAYSPQVPERQPLEGYINQGAASRLNQAGVSVPALGIENTRTNSNSPSTVSSTTTGQAPVNELQARFSQMKTSGSSSPTKQSQPPPPPPSRFNAYESQTQPQAPQGLSSPGFSAEAARKKAPPPPPKKKGMRSNPVGDEPLSSTPPPVPLSTKPR